MNKIIGFEGGWTDDVPVAWGLAAIWTEEGTIINSATNAVLTLSAFDELVKDEAVTQTPHFSVVDFRTPIAVIAIRQSSPSSPFFENDVGCSGLLRANGITYFAYSYPEGFNAYVDETVRLTSNHALTDNADPQVHDSTWRALLSLDPLFPLTHVVRRLRAQEAQRERIRLMSLATLRHNPDLEREYERLWTVLSRGKGDV